MLHVITQRDFLSRDLQNFIYLLNLMTNLINLWTKRDNCIRSCLYWCFFVALAFFMWYKKCLSSQLLRMIKCLFHKQKRNSVQLEIFASNLTHRPIFVWSWKGSSNKTILKGISFVYQKHVLVLFHGCNLQIFSQFSHIPCLIDTMS